MVTLGTNMSIQQLTYGYTEYKYEYTLYNNQHMAPLSANMSIQQPTYGYTLCKYEYTVQQIWLH